MSKTLTVTALLTGVVTLGQGVFAEVVDQRIQVCGGCHALGAPAGGQGHGVDGQVQVEKQTIPPIGGDPEHLYQLMIAMKTGQRAVTVMDRILRGYTDAELKEMAQLLGALGNSGDPGDLGNRGSQRSQVK